MRLWQLQIAILVVAGLICGTLWIASKMFAFKPSANMVAQCKQPSDSTMREACEFVGL